MEYLGYCGWLRNPAPVGRWFILLQFHYLQCFIVTKGDFNWSRISQRSAEIVSMSICPGEGLNDGDRVMVLTKCGDAVVDLETFPSGAGALLGMNVRSSDLGIIYLINSQHLIA